MPRSIEEIKADIARVQAQIAEQKQVPQPKTNVGWASYIMNDDPHLLDMYQNAERQWNQMQEQNKLTKELAAQNRQEQQMYAMDDNMKNRSLAAIKYNYAKQAKENDISNDKKIAAQLEQAEAEAKAELDYWNKRTGFDVKPEPKKEEVLAPKVEGPNLEGQIVDIDSESIPETDEEQSKKVEGWKANPAYNQDKNFRKAVNDYANKKSKEKVNKERTAALAKLNEEFGKITKAIDKANFLKSHPEVKANKGKLEWSKK